MKAKYRKHVFSVKHATNDLLNLFEFNTGTHARLSQSVAECIWKITQNWLGKHQLATDE